MLIVYAILFVLALWKIKFAGKGFFAEESFSRDVTDSIKGIFIWLVFLSHFASYVVYSAKIDVFGHKISLILGQLIVACFLFYSGYGVMEAISGVLRGMGASVTPTVLSLIGTCFARVAWVFTVFATYPTVEVLFLCYPLTWIFASLLQFGGTAVFYLKLRRKERVPEPAVTR